jgi:hypothetical protein
MNGDSAMTTVTGPVTGPPRAPARLTMTPGRWVTLLIGVPIALGLILGSGLSLVSDIGMASLPVNGTIPLQHGRLVVSSNGGDLTVVPGPASGGAARVTGTVQYSLVRPDFSVQGTSIDFHCRYLIGNCQLNSSLSVPPRTALDLSSGGGDIRVSGIQSAVKLASDGGDISLSGAVGATVSTSGGDLNLSNITGIAKLTTDGGDVGGSGLLSPNVDVGSGGGDVALVFTKVPGTVVVNSNGGDIAIVVPRGPTQYRLNVTTDGGDYQPTLSENQAAADQITVDSGGGDVSITEAS